MRRIPIRFKPKDKIRRVCGSRELVVFYPGTEYHGEILGDGTILSESNKCPKSFKLRKKEVQIIEYL